MIFSYRLLRTYFAESFEHLDRGGERNLLPGWETNGGNLVGSVSKELDNHMDKSRTVHCLST